MAFEICHFRDVYDASPTNTSSNISVSSIFFYEWRLTDLHVAYNEANLFLNLSSNTSAGPLVLDQTRDRIYYIDNHPISPYIGIAPLRPDVAGSFTLWLPLTERVFGLTLDAYFSRRKV